MPFDTLNPAWIVLTIFAVALLAPKISRIAQGKTGWVLAVVPAVAFAFFLSMAGPVWEGEIWRTSLPWAPDLGFNWDLWLSPLGVFLALLVTGIGALVTIYAGGYLGGTPQQGRFFLCLFLFMGAMLGLAVTENLIVFFVFWELTSIASFLLIGFNHANPDARKAALNALLITGGGGLAFLAGILLLGQVGGSFRLGELIENREAVLAHPLSTVISICIILGAVTKSAQVPFHFWLPGAMAAPAPVSAYLHSATMVKAGVFLLALLHPLIGGTPLWHFTLIGLGCLTMTWGALVAMVQTDLKRLLAYSTISTLGTLVMLLGMENVLAAKAAIVLFIVHALYKGALFMVAGIIEKATGSRDIAQLHGLMRGMPVLGISAVLAAASMSGLPPFVGFIAKELLYEVKLEAPPIGYVLLICGIIANAANIIVALKVGVAPFLFNNSKPTPLLKKPSTALLIGPVVLGVGSLIFGLFPQTILGGAVTSMVNQIQVNEVPLKLKLWHGLNLAFLLSVATFCIGLVGFSQRRHLANLGNYVKARASFLSGAQLFQGLMYGVISFAGLVTRTVQSDNLRTYFISILSTFVVLLIWAFTQMPYEFEVPEFTNFRLDVAMVTVFIATNAAFLPIAKQRFTAVLLLGGVGFGISALFALYGAPDLALTQLLVETLTLVLFSLAIYNLPRFPRATVTQRPKLIALGLSVAFGLGITILTLKALALEFQEPVSLEIAALSLPEAYGRNVVNVTLVDFRALDTLGEIAVLAIASLGVAAILRGSCRQISLPPTTEPSAVLLASARYTAPAMIIFSLYLLMRGHNEPGGGFIGGLVGAMAAVLSHLAQPTRPLRLFRLAPVPLIGIGLGLAVLSGIPGLIAEASFAAAQWGPEFNLPAIGKVKIGTPLLFDIGVYLLVIGIILLLYDRMHRWNDSSTSAPHSTN